MLDGITHGRGEGDSLFYDASRPRQWENTGKRATEILLIVLRAP